jgi:hypothetical protein
MAPFTTYGTLADSVELKKPSYRQPHTMDPRTWLRDLSPYFLYVLLTSTVGPLLFGYHLVSCYIHYSQLCH